MFYGWWIVVQLFFAAAFSGATIWYGFTAFYDPLVSEFGWSYTAISLAASLRGVEIGLMDIIVGFLVDRFGGRRVMFVGAMLIGIGYLMLSRINSLATFYISFLIICCGGSGFSSAVVAPVISRWFSKRLGLAFGLVMSGVGAAGFAMPGIVYLLELVGFRMVFVIFGIMAFIIGGVIAYFLRSRPEDIGCGPDGAPLDEGKYISEHVTTHTTRLIAPARDYTFKEAVSKSAFWIITYVSAVTIFSLTMVITHVMPYLEHIGYPRYTASIVAMMIPVMSIVGRLGIGWLSDVIGRRTVFILAVAGQVIGIVLFLYARLSFSLIAFVILFGVSYGGIMVLRPAVLRDFYGKTYLGSIYGVSLGMTTMGSLGGPLLAGWLFDLTGSYQLAWLISGIPLLIGIPLLLMMKNPPVTEKECS